MKDIRKNIFYDSTTSRLLTQLNETADVIFYAI